MCSLRVFVTTWSTKKANVKEKRTRKLCTPVWITLQSCLCDVFIVSGHSTSNYCRYINDIFIFLQRTIFKESLSYSGHWLSGSAIRAATAWFRAHSVRMNCNLEIA
jgi:hypothetical protein